jgi:8-oxo-dGTP pyrophosphatase MutT (NUDIX family)
MTKPPTIRPIVIGLFLYNGKILVGDAYDPTKNQTFYRPLGGAIEFGEYGEDALRREIREEINTEITGIRYLGMMENLFTFDGIPAHEIVLVYDAEFTDKSLYEQPSFIGDEGGIAFTAQWLPPSAFSPVTPIYPDGILEFLMEKGILLPESRTQDAETATV